MGRAFCVRMDSALVDDASPSTSADPASPTSFAEFSSSSVNSQQHFVTKYASSNIPYHRCNLHHIKLHKHSFWSRIRRFHSQQRYISSMILSIMLMVFVIPLYNNVLALTVEHSNDLDFNFSSSSANSAEATPPLSYELIKSKARLHALKHIQRSIDHYSRLTAESLLKKAAESSSDINSDRMPYTHRFANIDAENSTDHNNAKSSAQQLPSPSAGAFMRVRVGIRDQNGDERNASKSSQATDFNSVELLNNNLGNKDNENNELVRLKPSDELRKNNKNNNDKNEINSSDAIVGKSAMKELFTSDDNSNSSNDDGAVRRRLRSASTRFVHTNNGLHRHRHQIGQQQHRRRRKGCPPMHGKDQLLCPSRNVHRYDVCVTREQLCNHVQDCPNGEDEDATQCFFYKPLDDQLKTLSHAVLLLVESVMSEQQQQRAKARDEDL